MNGQKLQYGNRRMNRLEKIEARLVAATPGPWDWNSYSGIWAFNTLHTLFPGDETGFQLAYINQLPEQTVGGDELHDAESQGNAELIAHAPVDLELLIRIAKAALKLSSVCTQCIPGEAKALDDMIDALAPVMWEE